MKKLFTCLVALVWITGAMAQSPAKMSYQAVIRDNNDLLAKDKSIGMQISILQGTETGTAVYVERHFTSTNENGLATIIIGDGTIVSGVLDNIDWGNGPYYLKSEIDLNGGANYTISGTSQLLSVPYALYSESVASKDAQFDTLTVTNALYLGTNEVSFNDAIEMTGTTDATDNYIFAELPLGYNTTNTRVLSVEISATTGMVPFTSTKYYGLGYAGTNGTVGYVLSHSSLVQIGHNNNSISIYYPDELKDHPFRVFLVKAIFP